jgi:hypothetical protein
MSDILNILRGYGELTERIKFNVVSRHPLADETEWLGKLNIKKEDCFFTDVIWAFEDKLIFLSFFSTFNETKKTYVNYEFDSQAKYGDVFSIATLKFPLERKHIEAGLNYLSKWLSDENNEILKIKPLKFVQITDQDIC